MEVTGQRGYGLGALPNGVSPLCTSFSPEMMQGAKGHGKMTQRCGGCSQPLPRGGRGTLSFRGRGKDKGIVRRKERT